MFALSKQLTNLPIFSLQTGASVATSGKPIIDADKLAIEAFYCHAGRVLKNSAVLLVRDVRQIAREGMVIDSFEEIEDASEIVRLGELIKRNFQLMGLPVVNESGYRLGRVEEYTVSLEDFRIQKLYLRQSLIKNLLLNNLVIDRSQIVDVTNKKIIVRDASVKSTMLATPVVPK